MTPPPRWARPGVTVFLLVFSFLACGSPDESESPGQASTPASPDDVAAPERPKFIQQIAWSPDGAKLLFCEIDIVGQSSRIYTINPDGSERASLTEGPKDLWASWSPDGSKIVYGSTRDDNGDIYVMNADGNGSTRLTDHPASDSEPSWSPDGSTIAFTSEREGERRIYLMDADGSDPRRIGEGPGTEYAPRWSPDGRKLAYYATVAPGEDHVYLMNADGTGSTRLVAGFWPSWFPDGSRLIFPAHDGGLFVVEVEGGERRQLLEGDIVLGEWSPDGSTIGLIRVTWTAPEGWPSTSEIFLSDADGSGETRIGP